MSGHSHWATIKHKKGAADAKRGRLWSKIARMIIVAAKNGGGDPNSNLVLRYAIDKARGANMPKDTIDKAIKRGTGEIEGAAFESMQYEGYGPNGVAIVVEVLTDNRNRTGPEVKRIFEKHGGALGTPGCVSWMFHKKGDILVPKSAAKEDDLMNIVLESGGEDLHDDGDNWEIITETSAYEAVLEAVKKAGITPASAGIAHLPQNYIKLEGQAANTMIRLMEALEEHDDVQNVHANFDIDQKLLEEVAG
jgi:YebC/PmpR family DNA-binding regulatory protein